MSQVYIANTHFEFELASSCSNPIEKSLYQHKLCLQLQFLPLLFASDEDLVAVTQLPDQSYLENLENMIGKPLPKLVLMHEIYPFIGKKCLSWGPSRQVAAWAAERQMEYSLPSWEIIREINSKAFSYSFSPFKEAKLIFNQTDLESWILSTKGVKVIKSCYGLSGMGHRLLEEKADIASILPFCQSEWRKGHPVVAEPWVDRLFDFSTQWVINQDKSEIFLGATVFQTNAKGGYTGTVTGEENIIFGPFINFLDEHKKIVQTLLSKLSQMGYFGPIGIDALIYLSPFDRQPMLYPIVEINGRQTLSLTALKFQQRYFPHESLEFNLKSNRSDNLGLLPDSLSCKNGKIIHFAKNLYVR